MRAKVVCYISNTANGLVLYSCRLQRLPAADLGSSVKLLLANSEDESKYMARVGYTQQQLTERVKEGGALPMPTVSHRVRRSYCDYRIATNLEDCAYIGAIWHRIRKSGDPMLLVWALDRVQFVEDIGPRPKPHMDEGEGTYNGMVKYVLARKDESLPWRVDNVHWRATKTNTRTLPTIGEAPRYVNAAGTMIRKQAISWYTLSEGLTVPIRTTLLNTTWPRVEGRSSIYPKRRESEEAMKLRKLNATRLKRMNAARLKRLAAEALNNYGVDTKT